MARTGLLIAALVFLGLWFLNGALIHLPSGISQLLVAGALACAVLFAFQQARRRRTPPDR